MIDPWKLLFTGGLISLILGSLITIVVIRQLVPRLQSQRSRSLRDHHQELISRLGGIGIAWAFLTTVLLLFLLPVDERGEALRTLPPSRFWGFTLGAMLAWALGFADDLWDLPARWKLLGQLGLGGLAVASGFELSAIQGPFFQSMSLGGWGIFLTVLWVVGIINAINLIDGLDGLASGVALLALGALVWILVAEANVPLLLLTFIVLGATFSFWTFNRPTASIFMGDSGAYFLGYSLAILTLWGTEISGKQSTLPLLILAVPILDTGFAIFRRLLKGIPFYSADKDHIHHRLLAKGLSPLAAMGVMVGVSGGFGLLALFAYRRPDLQGFAYLGGLALAWMLLYFLEYDVIRTPVSSIRGQSDHRRQRALMIALGQQMETFLEKDPEAGSVFRSIRYWGDLAGAARIEVRKAEQVLWTDGPSDQSHRTLLFQSDSWEVRWGLPEASWTLDSDVKGELLDQVSQALFDRLQQLDAPKVLPLCQRPR